MASNQNTNTPAIQQLLAVIGDTELTENTVTGQYVILDTMGVKAQPNLHAATTTADLVRMVVNAYEAEGYGFNDYMQATVVSLIKANAEKEKKSKTIQDQLRAFVGEVELNKNSILSQVKILKEMGVQGIPDLRTAKTTNELLEKVQAAYEAEGYTVEEYLEKAIIVLLKGVVEKKKEEEEEEQDEN